MEAIKKVTKIDRAVVAKASLHQPKPTLRPGRGICAGFNRQRRAVHELRSAGGLLYPSDRR